LWRYADFSVHPQHRNLIVSVLEDHTESVLTSLVTINIETKSKSTLLQGAYPAFYSSPLISPDGKFISFVQWFLPDMRWEGGETVLAPISSDGSSLKIGDLTVIAGKRGEYSSQQPEWISDDQIILLSDQPPSEYLIPYIYTISTKTLSPVLNPTVGEDFGEPPWYFGLSNFAIFKDSSRGLFSSVRKNESTLYLIDLKQGSFEDLNTPYNDISRIRRVSDDSIVFIGAKADEANAVVQFILSTGVYNVLKTTSDIVLPDGIISLPQFKAVPSDSGPIYCTFYGPQNPDYEQNKDEKPPVVVNIHGGPTARTPQGFSLGTQYYTSRGFGW
jgi:hypothetical protein